MVTKNIAGRICVSPSSRHADRHGRVRRFALAAAAVWLWTAQAAFSDSPAFSQEQLQASFARYAPAVGYVRYTHEITNPNTGESTKRDNLAPALVVSRDGLVMTHGHMVLENAQPFNIRVILGKSDEEKEYGALLLKKPDDVNIAFLRIQSEEPLNLPFVRFSTDALPTLGAPLSMIGLMGDTMDYAHCVYEARIGAILEKPRLTLCFDEALRFGFVGGPVIDLAGRVVGVVGLDLNRNEGGDLYVRSGHPLLYQAALFQRYIDNPPGPAESTSGSETDAWLGVFTQPLTDAFAAYWGLPKDGGLIISTVVPGSPAAAADLRPGDVIVEFNGTPIRTKLDREVIGFTKLVRDAGAGQEVLVRVLRGGQPVESHIKLAVRPRSSGEATEYEDTVLGLTVREITTDLRIALNLPEEVQGVIVRRVKPGSAAEIGKMRPSVVVMRIGDYPIASIEDFKAAVERTSAEKPAQVIVFGRYGPATGFFRLEPRWNNGAEAAQPEEKPSE